MLGGRDGTGGSGVHVHLDKVEGFAGDFFFFPSRRGRRELRLGVSHLFFSEEDPFVLIIQVHLGNCFPEFCSLEPKVLLFVKSVSFSMCFCQ